MPGTLVLIGLYGTADLGGRVRLHVPGVELAGRADQEQADAVDVLVGADGAGGLQREEVGKRQPQATEAERARVQEVAPRQAVAEMHGLVRVELDHDASGSANCNK